MPSEQIGLIILGSVSAFSVWSAFNPSLFTLRKFAEPLDISTINKGMTYALAAILALSAGIYLIYKKEGTVAAIATASTGVGMFFLSQSMIRNPVPTGIAKEIPVAMF